MKSTFLTFLFLGLTLSTTAGANITKQDCEKLMKYQQEIYPVCQDAKDLTQATYEQAIEKEKTALFVFGYSTCGWCQSIHQILKGDKQEAFFKDACPEAQEFVIQEIPVMFPYVDMVKKEWAYQEHSGKAIVKDMFAQTGVKLKGYPAIVIVDPKDPSQMVTLNTGELEDNSSGKGHDYQKLCHAFKAAKAQLQK